MVYKDMCNLYNKYNTKLTIMTGNIILNRHFSKQRAATSFSHNKKARFF